MCLTPSCLRRGSDRDQDPRRQGKMGLYPTLHCHHRNGFSLRWAVVWAIWVFHSLWGAVSQSDSVHAYTTTSEEKGEPEWNRTNVLMLASLTPSRLAKPAERRKDLVLERSCSERWCIEGWVLCWGDGHPHSTGVPQCWCRMLWALMLKWWWILTWNMWCWCQMLWALVLMWWSNSGCWHGICGVGVGCWGRWCCCVEEAVGVDTEYMVLMLDSEGTDVDVIKQRWMLT